MIIFEGGPFLLEVVPLSGGRLRYPDGRVPPPRRHRRRRRRSRNAAAGRVTRGAVGLGCNSIDILGMSPTLSLIMFGVVRHH